jgi:hypothetical protein
LGCFIEGGGQGEWSGWESGGRRWISIVVSFME